MADAAALEKGKHRFRELATGRCNRIGGCSGRRERQLSARPGSAHAAATVPHAHIEKAPAGDALADRCFATPKAREIGGDTDLR